MSAQAVGGAMKAMNDNNVFSFEMEYMNSSFTEAVETLAGRAGITLPEAPQKAERP